MRRFKALLIAGLAAAPASVAAEPSPSHDCPAAAPAASLDRPRLGVQVMPLTPELRRHFGAADDRGVLIARVEPLSPASLGGLRAGDVLTKVRGRAVADAAAVRAALADAPRDQTAELTVIRDGRPLAISVKFAAAPVSLIDGSWLRALILPLASAEHAHQSQDA